MRNPHFSAIAMGLTCLLNAGCAHSADAPETKVDTRLIFSNAPTGIEAATGVPFSDTFLWSGLEKFKTKPDDDRLQAECLKPAGKNQVALGAILSFFIGPVVSLISDKIKSALDDELKKYSAESKASEQSSFYVAENGHRVQHWRCFRVTRVTTTTSASPKGPVTRTLDFDFLGQVAVMSDKDTVFDRGTEFEGGFGLKIRPLRIYVGKPLAKGDKVAMVGTVTFDAVWREGEVGKQATLFTAPVFEQKFNRAADKKSWSPSPYYFPETGADGTKDKTKFPAWESLPLQPYVPVSTVGPQGTVVTVTFTTTEVGSGDGEATLKAIRKLFGAAQSDLNSAVTKAGTGLINPEKPTPPAKPDLFCGTITPTDGGGGAIQWQKTDAATCPGASG